MTQPQVGDLIRPLPGRDQRPFEPATVSLIDRIIGDNVHLTATGFIRVSYVLLLPYVTANYQRASVFTGLWTSYSADQLHLPASDIPFERLQTPAGCVLQVGDVLQRSADYLSHAGLSQILLVTDVNPQERVAMFAVLENTGRWSQLPHWRPFSEIVGHYHRAPRVSPEPGNMISLQNWEAVQELLSPAEAYATPTATRVQADNTPTATATNQVAPTNWDNVPRLHGVPVGGRMRRVPTAGMSVQARYVYTVVSIEMVTETFELRHHPSNTTIQVNGDGWQFKEANLPESEWQTMWQTILTPNPAADPFEDAGEEDDDEVDRLAARAADEPTDNADTHWYQARLVHLSQLSEYYRSSLRNHGFTAGPTYRLEADRSDPYGLRLTSYGGRSWTFNHAADLAVRFIEIRYTQDADWVPLAGRDRHDLFAALTVYRQGRPSRVTEATAATVAEAATEVVSGGYEVRVNPYRTLELLRRIASEHGLHEYVIYEADILPGGHVLAIHRPGRDASRIDIRSDLALDIEVRPHGGFAWVTLRDCDFANGAVTPPARRPEPGTAAASHNGRLHEYWIRLHPQLQRSACERIVQEHRLSDAAMYPANLSRSGNSFQLLRADGAIDLNIPLSSVLAQSLQVRHQDETGWIAMGAFRRPVAAVTDFREQVYQVRFSGFYNIASVFRESLTALGFTSNGIYELRTWQRNTAYWEVVNEGRGYSFDINLGVTDGDGIEQNAEVRIDNNAQWQVLGERTPAQLFDLLVRNAAREVAESTPATPPPTPKTISTTAVVSPTRRRQIGRL